jgi:GNAT superfamily N-acetyltransferase
MSFRPEISALKGIPSDLEGLVQASTNEGFGLVERLRDEWKSGANTFTLAGEALFEARQKGRLIGICGLNRDPYADDPSIGRVRRLYVAPEARRMGVGRRLVSAVLREACSHFAIVRARTTTPEGALFYQALGFHRTGSVPTATHEIRVSLDGPAV